MADKKLDFKYSKAQLAERAKEREYLSEKELLFITAKTANIKVFLEACEELTEEDTPFSEARQRLLYLYTRFLLNKMTRDMRLQLLKILDDLYYQQCEPAVPDSEYDFVEKVTKKTWIE